MKRWAMIVATAVLGIGLAYAADENAPGAADATVTLDGGVAGMGSRLRAS